MATSKQPVSKKCRSFEVSPAVMGYSNKKSTRQPGGNRRRKVSEYGAQLKEKQKVKFIYGVLEKQFAKYFEKAAHMKGITGDNMLQLLELRLDSVVGAGFGLSREKASALIRSGRVSVNGLICEKPDRQLAGGETVSARGSGKFRLCEGTHVTKKGRISVEIEKFI